jgi:ABC-type transporter Mla subunit MlaD
MLPPGGGVRGYCAEHSNEAVIEAVERLNKAIEVQAAHLARIDSNIGSIENVTRVTAQQRRR